MFLSCGERDRDFSCKGTRDLDGGGDAAEHGVSSSQLAAVISTPSVRAAKSPLEDNIIAIAAVEIGYEMIDRGAVSQMHALAVDEVCEAPRYETAAGKIDESQVSATRGCETEGEVHGVSGCGIRAGGFRDSGCRGEISRNCGGGNGLRQSDPSEEDSIKAGQRGHGSETGKGRNSGTTFYKRIPDLGEAEVLEVFYVGGGETGDAVVAEGEGETGVDDVPITACCFRCPFPELR